MAVHPNLGGSKKARFISVSKNILSSCCGGAAFDASMAALLLFIFSFVPLPPRDFFAGRIFVKTKAKNFDHSPLPIDGMTDGKPKGSEKSTGSTKQPSRGEATRK